MAPSILVVGGTGNTGKAAVNSLPGLLKASKTFSDHRVLVLTRSSKTPVAQAFAELPHVDVLEKDWTDIDAEWLQQHEVERVYIAAYNGASQFTDESGFYVALLQAGVKYVVRVSTTAQNVQPATGIYYGRTHWAIEHMLSQSEFSSLQWTSLQPMVFTTEHVRGCAEWINQYRKTGAQSNLHIGLDMDSPVGLIDPADVGSAGAALLVQDDPAQHNQAKYILNGPEDVCGRDLVALVENIAGVKVEHVTYKSTRNLEEMGAKYGLPAKIVNSLKLAFASYWKVEPSLSAHATSKAILDLSPPLTKVASTLEAMLTDSGN